MTGITSYNVGRAVTTYNIQRAYQVFSLRSGYKYMKEISIYLQCSEDSNSKSMQTRVIDIVFYILSNGC